MACLIISARFICHCYSCHHLLSLIPTVLGCIQLHVAEYLCFTWSDCLSDLHNPVTGQERKDLRMTARTNSFTCSPRHGGATPPTSILRASTEKFIHTYHHACIPQRVRQMCTYQCTPTVRAYVFLRSHVIGGEPLAWEYTKKVLMEKPKNTFCPTWESNPGPQAHQSRLGPAVMTISKIQLI